MFTANVRLTTLFIAYLLSLFTRIPSFALKYKRNINLNLYTLCTKLTQELTMYNLGLGLP